MVFIGLGVRPLTLNLNLETLHPLHSQSLIPLSVSITLLASTLQAPHEFLMIGSLVQPVKVLVLPKSRYTLP